MGAEPVDSIASGYLDSLGHGRMIINYAAHETGDLPSDYLTEAQQFGPKAGEAIASGDAAASAPDDATPNQTHTQNPQTRVQVNVEVTVAQPDTQAPVTSRSHWMNTRSLLYLYGREVTWSDPIT